MQVQKEEYTKFKDLLESMSGSTSAIVEELEIIDSIIDLVERAENMENPMLIEYTDDYCDIGYCPECGFEFEEAGPSWEYRYCPMCGRRVETGWSDEDETD